MSYVSVTLGPSKEAHQAGMHETGCKPSTVQHASRAQGSPNFSLHIMDCTHTHIRQSLLALVAIHKKGLKHMLLLQACA